MRSLGQGCTWYGGLTITVPTVGRTPASGGRTGYSVRVRLTNRTPKSYAAAAMTVDLWAGPDDRTAAGTTRAGLGPGMLDTVIPPGKTATGTYGYLLPRPATSNRVAVGITPDPTDQQCLLRGTARSMNH